MVLEELAAGAVRLLDPGLIAIIVFGIFVGIIAGGIPGMGGAIVMAISLPFTISFAPDTAIILLVAIYSGSMYGGSISAILINTPGTAAAAATTLDGYPLARKGEAKVALMLSVISSGLSGFFGVMILIAISPIIIEIVLLFGSLHYFLVAVLGLTMITVVAEGNLLKGLGAGLLGILISTIGLSEATGEARFTFDFLLLYDGINFVAVLLGVFAIAEMLKLSTESGGIAKATELEGSYLEGLRIFRNNVRHFFKSSVIGVLIGAVPGAGSSVSTFVAYSEAVRSSKDGNFGDGDYRGVIASESSNNSNIGGSLIPTLSFGIPGSGSTAVLLAGLIMHGLVPGPQLFTTEIETTYAILISLLFGNVIIISAGLLFIPALSIFTKIDTDVIIPVVIVLSIVGSFMFRFSLFDVFTVVAFGIVGYYMKEYNYSVIALILGVILGPIMEENLYRAMRLYDDRYLAILSDPVALLLLFLIGATLIYPVISRLKDGISPT